jgi:hypothetical protein
LLLNRWAVRMARSSMSCAPSAGHTEATYEEMPEKGGLAPGADADLVVLGPDGKIEETIVAGRTVYARQEDET